MRRFGKLLLLAGLATSFSFNIFSQGTLFTYQGRLNNGDAPVNGTNYGLTFNLFDVPTNGMLLAQQNIANVTVSNGLFIVPLDFGAVFDGSPRWLQITISAPLSPIPTTLWPRQQITPTPYAVFANTASNLSGTIPSSQLSGSIAATNLSGTVALAQLPSSVLTNGASGVSVSGTFSGNGSGITGVNLISANSQGAFSWITNSTGNFVPAFSLGTGLEPSSATASDVNGDGKMDLISANLADSTLTIFTNNGNGGFIPASSPGVGTDPISVTTADVNGDGKIDLISANFNGDTLTVLTNDGSGGFVIASSPGVGSRPDCVVAADVNGDNKIDLICANYAAGLTVLTNDGSGRFVTASSPTVGNGPYCVTAADVNGDGKMDVISANRADSTLTVLTNNGTGGFITASTPSTGLATGPTSVTAADINGDGKLDLISANEITNTLTVLTNSGKGIFAIASSPIVGNNPTSVAAADVNGDGKVDIICGLGADTVVVLTNNGSGGLVIASTLKTSFPPDGIVAVDVNNDSTTDLVVPDTASALEVFTNAPSLSASFHGDGTGLNLGNTVAYTPTIGDGVNNFNTTIAQGYYTKMGNVVFVEIWLQWSGKGSANPASTLEISLPFASSSQRPAFSLGYINGITFNAQLNAAGGQNSTNANLWSLASGGAPTAISVSGCAASGEIQLSGTFRH